jgi:trimeric autotransporter adhesin
LDKDGQLLIADSLNFKVKRVGSNGTIVTVAGNGQLASTGNGGSATLAALAEPADAFGAADGSLYISNLRNGGIRVVSPAGVIGNFSSRTLDNPVSMLPMPDGGFLIIRKVARIVSRVNGEAITPFAGIQLSDGIGDSGPAESAKFFIPLGVAVAANRDVFVSDFKDVRVRRIRNGLISTVATAQGEALAFDRGGRLHATNGSSVVRIEAYWSTTRLMGTGVAGFAGDTGVANTARLQFAEGLAFDANDTMHITDTRNHRVRRVDGTTGIITTLAGTGVPGYGGDGGAATAAQLNFPCGLAVGPDGTVYIADSDNQRVRAVGRDGVIRTFAGRGAATASGEGGLASAAGIPTPMDVAADRDGTVYISGLARASMMAGAGVLRTIAGTGTTGFNGDGGLATEAQLFVARGIDVDRNRVV